MTNIIGKLVAGEKASASLERTSARQEFCPIKTDDVRAYQGLENHISKQVNTACL
jgi:hypothetical protein